MALIPLAGRRANGVPFALDASVRVLADGGLLCVLRELDRNAPGTLDAAFDAMPIGMALFNTDGEYVRVNGALCALLGRGADELIGMRDQELTHPDDRQSDLDAAWRILNGELSSWQCEKRFVRPDGSIVWTLASLTFLRDEHERPLCWVGQFQDITELRRMASRDPLTDALNRRAFDIELERAPRRGAAGPGPRRLQGHQRRPRPPRGRRAAAPDRGRDPRPAAPRRRARAARRRRVRRAAAALRRGARRRSSPTTSPRWSPRSGSSSTASSAASPPASAWRAVAASGEALSAADRAMYDAKAVGGNRVRRAH